MKNFLIVTNCAVGLMFASQMPQAMAQQGRTNGRTNSTQPRRDNSKRQLQMLWNGVWRIEGSMAPLSASQAKRLVAAVRPWSSKSSMTEAQAKSLVSTLNGVLTSTQRSVVGDLNSDGPGGRDMGGPPPDGMGGPPPDGNGPPPGGGRGDGPPGMNTAAMKMMATMNPFYAPTGYSTFKSLPQRMQTQLLHRYQESRATLIALSRKAG